MKKNNDQSMKFLCLFIVIIAFTLAFALLINKQKDNNLADIGNSNFNVKPEYGKVIVAKDLETIYPKFYVIYVDDFRYTVYSYNYYETISQYNLEYNRLIDSIVDYNKNDKMIRCLDKRGYGTYDEVLNKIQDILGRKEIKIY